MPKIKLLPPHLISRTAAGEVVERPASVVKELIENSLDAKATQIKIEIEDSGLKKIKVIDNGIGMDGQDIWQCIQHHATSKIYTEEDLASIKSFGFRGEALSSIASVSRLNIQSRVEGQITGNRLEIESGDVKRALPAGMPYGTNIEVLELFFNTPARKKFLKTPQTEFRNVLDVVVNIAFAFSDVAFTLIHDKRIILDLPRYQTLQERAASLLGEPISSQFLPVSHHENYFRLSGFVSRPQISSLSKSHQYIFVNKRYVTNHVISAAVKEAFGSLLDTRSHPALILFFDLPFDLVDVNVHPRKEEISFYDDSLVFSMIKNAVQKTLTENDLTYISDISGNNIQDKKALPYLFQHLKDTVSPWHVYEAENTSEEVLQVNNLYLVAQTKKGILVVDQHAAHERILFEQFLDVYEKFADNGECENLSDPLVFDLSVQDSELLEEHIKTLAKLGFDIEQFGLNTYKLCAIPKVLSGTNVLDLINDILEDLRAGRTPSNINEKSIRTIAYLACRGAIKAGDYLSPQERKDLIKKLSETKTEYTCPHGRPVKVEFTMRELEKLFKRVK